MSIALAAAIVALSIATLALLIIPFFWTSRRRGFSRAEVDLRIYRDQLAEIDRDAARHLLGPAEAEAARAEVKRRLLAAADAAEVAERASTPSETRRRWIPPTVLALVLPATAVGLYLTLGQPIVPDQPFAERRTQEMLTAGLPPDEVASLADATAQLEKRLESRPDDATGWFLLGRSYLTLRQYPESVRAFSRAEQLSPEQPGIVDGYAEAMIANSGGRIEKNAHDALQRLLTLDPTNPKAQFLLALERAQNGDLAGAVQDWARLLATAPPDAPWVPAVRDHLERAAALAGIPVPLAGPADGAPASAALPTISTDDMAAAAQMLPEDRQRMIRGMVEKLAARLADHPDDIDGWQRLARAWDVLGEPEKAAEARARVAALERR